MVTNTPNSDIDTTNIIKAKESDIVKNTNDAGIGYDIKDTFSNENRLASESSFNKTTNDITIIDNDWVTSKFMTPDSEMESAYVNLRYHSTADNKETDTSWGGNLAINAKPQFTQYADISHAFDGVHGLTRNKTTVHSCAGVGMGRYYSETIDDNAQQVFLEFGLPRFNNIIDFMTKAVDYRDSVIANTGRSPIGYTIGQAVGSIVILTAFPLLTISIWALKGVVGLLSSQHNFNYYYFTPTMNQYWGTVTNIFNQMAVELGVLESTFLPDKADPKNIGMPASITKESLARLSNAMPNILTENGYIDVYRISMRAQMMANRREIALYEAKERGEISEDIAGGGITDDGEVDKSLADKAKGIFTSINYHTTLASYTASNKKYYNTANNYLGRVDATDTSIEVDAQGNPIKASAPSKPERTGRNTLGGYEQTTAEIERKKDVINKFAEAFDSSVRDGVAYAIFQVNYTGTVSESFSNSTGNIGMADTVKSVATKARNFKFDMGGGSITPGIDKAVGYAKDVAIGVLNSVSMGLGNVITTLLGSAYVSVPKKWDDSSFSFPSVSYRMPLISPYGDQLSQLQNMYLPLAMILAGALPLATGKSSYTSPYLCKLFDKGVQRIDLGMITSVSITRGTSNLPFNKSKRALAIEVSFTVTDFSTLMAAPINASIFGDFGIMFDDDTPMGKYISVLGSRSPLVNRYTSRKLPLVASKKYMRLNNVFNSSRLGAMVGGEGLINSVLSPIVAGKSISGVYGK